MPRLKINEHFMPVQWSSAQCCLLTLFVMQQLSSVKRRVLELLLCQWIFSCHCVERPECPKMRITTVDQDKRQMLLLTLMIHARVVTSSFTLGCWIILCLMVAVPCVGLLIAVPVRLPFVQRQKVLFLIIAMRFWTFKLAEMNVNLRDKIIF